MQRDKPLGQTVDQLLAGFAGIGEPGALHGFDSGSAYYPSPGGLQELVRSVLVQIERKTVLFISVFLIKNISKLRRCMLEFGRFFNTNLAQ